MNTENFTSLIDVQNLPNGNAFDALKRYTLTLSRLALCVLTYRQTNLHSQLSKKCKTTAIHREIHSKKESVVLAWRLKMNAMPEMRGLYG